MPTRKPSHNKYSVDSNSWQNLECCLYALLLGYIHIGVKKSKGECVHILMLSEVTKWQ